MSRGTRGGFFAPKAFGLQSEFTRFCMKPDGDAAL